MTFAAGSIQRFLANLRGYEWLPVTTVRVLLGVFFCISGGPKLFSSSQMNEMVQTMVKSHIPFPKFNALFVSLLEFIGGAALVLGFLTPLWAVLLGADMVVATVTNRLSSVEGPGLINWLGNFLYLPEVLYALLLGWLLFAGPGRFSIDGFLARRWSIADVER